MLTYYCMDLTAKGLWLLDRAKVFTVPPLLVQTISLGDKVLPPHKHEYMSTIFAKINVATRNCGRRRRGQPEQEETRNRGGVNIFQFLGYYKIIPLGIMTIIPTGRKGYLPYKYKGETLQRERRERREWRERRERRKRFECFEGGYDTDAGERVSSERGPDRRRARRVQPPRRRGGRRSATVQARPGPAPQQAPKRRASQRRGRSRRESSRLGRHKSGGSRSGHRESSGSLPRRREVRVGRRRGGRGDRTA